MNKVRQLITGDRLRDCASGVKVMKRAVIDSLPSPRAWPDLHRLFGSFAHLHGFKVAEVKVATRPRARGKSNYGFKRLGEYLLRDFPALRRYRRSLRRR